eukprot:gene13867-13653_t
MKKSIQKVADLMLDAIFLVQDHGQIVFVNQAACAILGYRPEELVGRNLREFIYSKDLASTEAAMAKVLQGQHSRNFENRYVRKDGTIAHLQWSAYWMAEEQIRIGVARDVTERVQLSRTYESMAELATAAHHSGTLEMLCNSFYAILQRRTFCRGLALVLDGGRWSNVACGEMAQEAAALRHYPLEQAGIQLGELQISLENRHNDDDQILRFAAMQASAAIQRITLQAEFVASREQAEMVIDKIRHAVAQPVLLNAVRLHPSASIGLALYLQHGDSLRELMRHADVEMYADKMRQKSATGGVRN